MSNILNEPHAEVELQLVFPYKNKLDVIFEWAKQWHCQVINAGTLKDNVLIRIPYSRYEIIWGHLPIEGEDSVPEGMDQWVNGVYVQKEKI